MLVTITAGPYAGQTGMVDLPLPSRPRIVVTLEDGRRVAVGSDEVEPVA